MEFIQSERESMREYRFEQGARAGQAYYGVDRILCDDPTCACRTMLLMLHPVLDDEAPSPTEIRKIALDLGERGVAAIPSVGEYFLDEELSQAFAAELSQEQWLELRRDLEAQKRELFEGTPDLTAFKVDFSDLEPAIAEESAMVGFDEVFPYAPPFELEIDGMPYFAVDQYCVRPSCRCTEGILAVYRHDAEAVAGPAPLEPTAVVAWDYRSRRLELFDNPASTAEADRVVRSGASEFARLSGELRSRHRILRTLYRSYLERAGRESTVAPAVMPQLNLPKVGRNEPCPCGSGRKYKHCCGR